MALVLNFEKGYKIVIDYLLIPLIPSIVLPYDNFDNTNSS